MVRFEIFGVGVVAFVTAVGCSDEEQTRPDERVGVAVSSVVQRTLISATPTTLTHHAQLNGELVTLAQLDAATDLNQVLGSTYANGKHYLAGNTSADAGDAYHRIAKVISYNGSGATALDALEIYTPGADNYWKFATTDGGGNILLGGVFGNVGTVRVYDSTLTSQLAAFDVSPTLAGCAVGCRSEVTSVQADGANVIWAVGSVSGPSVDGGPSDGNRIAIVRYDVAAQTKTSTFLAASGGLNEAQASVYVGSALYLSGRASSTSCVSVNGVACKAMADDTYLAKAIYSSMTGSIDVLWLIPLGGSGEESGGVISYADDAGGKRIYIAGRTTSTWGTNTAPASNMSDGIVFRCDLDASGDMTAGSVAALLGLDPTVNQESTAIQSAVTLNGVLYLAGIYGGGQDHPPDICHQKGAGPDAGYGFDGDGFIYGFDLATDTLLSTKMYNVTSSGAVDDVFTLASTGTRLLFGGYTCGDLAATLDTTVTGTSGDPNIGTYRADGFRGRFKP